MNRTRTLSAFALSAAAAVLVLPDRLRIDHRIPFVDSVAWRPHATAVVAATAAVLAARPATRPLAAALGAVAAAAVPSIAARVWPRRVAAPSDGDLTVLSLNVLSGRADTGAVATLLERERPDLVALPEAGQDYREKLFPLIQGMGYRAWVSTDVGTRDVWGVTLLASERAGDIEVTIGPEMRRRYVRATGGILGDRSFIAVHPEAPMGFRGAERWRADMRQLARWCRDEPIVAGDFNATLDHRPLRAAMGSLRSAAAGTGSGLVGTFHSSLPRPLGIQIDHVLVPPGTATTRFEIVDVPGTDHRGVLAHLRLPSSTP